VLQAFAKHGQCLKIACGWLLTPVIDSRYCLGCGLCQAICPDGAISMVEHKHAIIGLD